MGIMGMFYAILFEIWSWRSILCSRQMASGVVVVTINYRLSTLGFLRCWEKNNCTVCRFLSYWLLLCLYNPSHSLGTEEVPGNMGMLDQVNFVSFCNNFLIVTKLGCCVTLGSGEHCIFWRRSSQGDLHQEPNQMCSPKKTAWITPELKL